MFWTAEFKMNLNVIDLCKINGDRRANSPEELQSK